jgi:hypothetical protein
MGFPQMGYPQMTQIKEKAPAVESRASKIEQENGGSNKSI